MKVNALELMILQHRVNYFWFMEVKVSLCNPKWIHSRPSLPPPLKVDSVENILFVSTNQ